MKAFDSIVRNAENRGLKVGWSNPCFEIWLQNYFADAKMQNDSVICVRDFENLLVKHTPRTVYSKSDPDIYKLVSEKGDEAAAVKRAGTRLKNRSQIDDAPSKLHGCTTVFKLIEEIRSKVQ